MVKRTTKSVTITARINPALSKKLTGYAKIAGHTKSRAVEDLLSRHLDYETYFIKAVREGIAAADRGELVSHEEAKRQIRQHIAKRKRERRKAA